MKLQILVGFPNQDGSGEPVIIGKPSGSAVEIQKQARIFDDAKRLHQFPKGVKFLAFGTFESNDSAIFINDKVAEDKVKAAKAARARVDHANALAKAKTDVVITRNDIPKAKRDLAIAKSKLPALEKAGDKKAMDAAQDAVTKAVEAVKAAEAAHAEATARFETLKKQ
jgi:hypothetical protein